MRQLKNQLYLLGTLSLVLSGCIEAPKSSSEAKTFTEDNPEVNRVNSDVKLITGTPESLAYEGITYEFVPDSPIPAGVRVVAQNLPSWATIDESTGVITGNPTGFGITNNILITAYRDTQYTQIGPFSLQVFGDPLFAHQWHLKNTGQNAFAQAAGNSGVDLSMEQVTSNRVLGSGVSIAISDTGLDVTHPELVNNLFPWHRDYNSANEDFYGNPRPIGSSGDHGTSVAGIIAAEGWNGEGGRGVAPGSLVSGLNYINSIQSNEIKLDQASGPYTLFNYSYGENFYPSSSTFDSTYQDQLLEGYLNGRNFLGQSYIKSAGNSYSECDDDYRYTYLIEGVGICYAHNANMDSENNMIPTIVVGSVNASGEKSSYSSTGSSLWVSGLGGEFGFYEPAIVTIDQQGCGKGYSRDGVNFTNFMIGEDPLNDNCDYTHMFNGTSSAAPMVTGVVALMLDVNPTLTARDIKYILAVTSDKINDPTFTGAPPHANSDFFALSGHTYEQGWVTNGAGYSFHNHFGFGLVNADKAVALARVYNSSWGSLVHLNKDFSSTTYRATPGSSIPDESATGRTSSIYVNSNLTIEAVQIKVNITHGRPGDLGIELTSPRGTKSILLNINNSLLIPLENDDEEPEWVADLTDLVLSSNAFYGESAQGWWTIKVIDGLGANTGTEFDMATNQTGTLDQWDINISGH